MKQTAVKFILLSFSNGHIVFKTLTVLFWQLAQVEQQNGGVNSNNPQQT